MINKETIASLEFEKILIHIARKCITEYGKKLVNELTPLYQADIIEIEGIRASEAKNFLFKNIEVPVEFLNDLRETISYSKIDGKFLEIKEVQNILQLLRISRFLAKFLSEHKESAVSLYELGNGLQVNKVLEHHIESIIDENGLVKDSASKELREIRKDLKSKKDDLDVLIMRILKRFNENEIVREDYITIRDGRFVVPVKAEYKRLVKGFIHSESATGQTVYIEPEETLNLNNEIVSLQFAEKREIERILMSITRKISEYSSELLDNHTITAKIDKYLAIARYSLEVDGSFPTLEIDSPFSIGNAKHPILIKKIGLTNTVPLNILIKNSRIIVLSGPNAGGKTVVLKTVGLLSLMVQSGIHIPASPDSNFYIFEDIFVDIGDKQSIEDDLSTFSSHLKNINRILLNSKNNSLVLLDELGTGTEPSAGTALSIAFLLTLKKTGSIVIAATHLSGLKNLCVDNPEIDNASMEFDAQELKPTYVFRQGMPGSSYAFEIALRIGIDNTILDLAKQYINPELDKFEKLLIEIEEKSRNLKAKLNEAEIEKSRLDGLTKVYSKKIDLLEKEKKIVLKETKEKGDKYLRDMKISINSIIKELRETKAPKEKIKEANSLIENLSKSTNELYTETAKEVDLPADFSIGDKVKIRNTETVGVIKDIFKEKEFAYIVSNNISIKVKLSDLHIASKEDKKKDSRLTDLYSNRDVMYRLDIRGHKPSEAEFELIKYLDNSYSGSIDKVEVLHGKGTGALKKMVKDVLLEHPAVKTFYYAPVEIGGDGITIVELK